eukprot:TRINITY_DN3509_c0_g1_i1.p1 TRINITY_DN3509_c0_g1~~TRINITY_DN3509_c0_g1_i1.p1  ORF type:complete len:207 (-),score=37.65 TRINITY_DN3509_c0_g1_i1:65-631(-)
MSKRKDRDRGLHAITTQGELDVGGHGRPCGSSAANQLPSAHRPPLTMCPMCSTGLVCHRISLVESLWMCPMPGCVFPLDAEDVVAFLTPVPVGGSSPSSTFNTTRDVDDTSPSTQAAMLAALDALFVEGDTVAGTPALPSSESSPTLDAMAPSTPPPTTTPQGKSMATMFSLMEDDLDALLLEAGLSL